MPKANSPAKSLPIWLCITKLRFMEKDKSKTIFTWCRYIRPEIKLHVYLMYVGTPGKQVMWRLVNHRLMQERRPNLIGSWSTEKKNTKNAVTITKTHFKRYNVRKLCLYYSLDQDFNIVTRYVCYFDKL